MKKYQEIKAAAPVKCGLPQVGGFNSEASFFAFSSVSTNGPCLLATLTILF